jgi:Tfp pilus assembly protein PilF
VAQASPPTALIFVCSDHGFYPATAAITGDPANLAGPATAWHRPYGIVGVAVAGDLISGRASATFGGRRDIGVVTPLDIAPTLLHAAGLPISSEMPGHVVTSMLPADIASRAPVRQLPAKFTPPSADAAVRPDADDARDRLRALGYVGAVSTSLARQNLAESFFRRGKYPAAERELRTVLEAQPQNVAAQLWLAQTMVRTGRSREALTVYERAVQFPGGAEDALVEATDVAIANGELERARRMVRTASADTFAAHVARGQLAEADRQPAAAEREYRLALDNEPTSFDAAARLLDLLKRSGRARDAREPLERAVRQAPDSPRLLGLAADLRLAVGDLAGAEQAARRALALAPDADSLRVTLGRTLLAQHKPAEAIAALSDAGSSPDRDILLGAAYSSTKDWAGAVEHLQKALDSGRTTPDVLNGLGWAEMQRGNRSRAAALFNQSLAARPDQPEIRRLLKDLGSAKDEPIPETSR